MQDSPRSTLSRNYLFTSESVTEGHPDKICDQVSDAILDALLAKEAELQAKGYISPSGVPASVDNVRCACETFVTTGTVVVAGEVRTEAYLDVQKIARDVIRRIGYDRAKYGFDCETCGVINMIHEQSPDIAQGVDESFDAQAGRTTDPLDLVGAGRPGHDVRLRHRRDRRLHAHAALPRLAHGGAPCRRSQGRHGALPAPRRQDPGHRALRGRCPRRGHEPIVVSTQHDAAIADMEHDARGHGRARHRPGPRRGGHRVAGAPTIYVNPTGRFVVGGPMGDTGLTGRKIIVDTYGGMGRHGGGAFSGKDCTKVDRSAAYAARWVAKNVVAAGLARRCEVQLAYAIGVAHPLSVMVDTFGTGARRGPGDRGCGASGLRPAAGRHHPRPRPASPHLREDRGLRPLWPRGP